MNRGRYKKIWKKSVPGTGNSWCEVSKDGMSLAWRLQRDGCSDVQGELESSVGAW